MASIVCIGETLWDVYPGRRYLGGAPLNVAVHLARLGETACLLSAVGRDELGRAALSQLAQLGVDCRFVTVNDRPTGTALVHPELEGDQRFDLPEDVAYDQLTLSEEALASLIHFAPDAIVFGTLAQKRSEQATQTICRTLDALPNAEAFLDVNLRKQLYDETILADSIDRCTILKLNEDEVDILSFLLFDTVMDPDRFARFLFSDFACHTVLVTRGSRGASAYSRTFETFHADPIPVDVVDTVGAGDAFSAGYLHEWLHSHQMAAALNAGNANGAKTTQHAGAF